MIFKYYVLYSEHCDRSLETSCQYELSVILCFLLISFYASISFHDITDFCSCFTVTGYNKNIYIFKKITLPLFYRFFSFIKSELMLQWLLDLFIHNYFSLAYLFCQLFKELNRKRASCSCSVVTKSSQKLIEPQ